MYCRNCGKQIDANAMICIYCGAETGKGKEYCANCGAKVEKERKACTVCGYALPKEKISIREFAKKKKKPLVLSGVVFGAVVIVILIVAIAVNARKSVNFRKLYDDYCSFTWAEVGEDGSYLYIDTNPYDEEDDGLAFPEAYYAVENINKELGLPSSLFKEIGKTTFADGKQVRTYPDLKLEISWKYHPDTGLEITYMKTK